MVMKIGEIVQIEMKQRSKVVQEFSRFAHKYDTYNMIQAKVAKSLVAKLPKQTYKNIIDIGCGSGEVYKNLQLQNISVENFVALDSAETMLDIHPEENQVNKICTNFNNRDFLTYIPQYSYDLLLSSSALQWSENLAYTMHELSLLSSIFYGAIFTSGTFKTLHEIAGIDSPIYHVEMVQDIIQQYYDSVQFEIHHYRLDFESTREMFRYIKQSGVSSGEKKLSYRQTKQLMENYPLSYLEFEVLFVEARR
jgi:malonyl-CoA O-methyltransferase